MGAQVIHGLAAVVLVLAIIAMTLGIVFYVMQSLFASIKLNTSYNQTLSNWTNTINSVSSLATGIAIAAVAIPLIAWFWRIIGGSESA